MSQFTIWDTLVLVVYIALTAAVGAWVGRKQGSTEDYFLGGRRIPWWAVGLSVMATQASAITFIGAPGWGYEGGLERLVTFVNAPLAIGFLIAFMVPVFYRSGVYTVYEFLERRFDVRARLLASLLFLLARGLATGIVLYAPALVLSVVTGWPTDWTILLMAVIAVSYTVLGGISAVIWTDVMQMVVLWLGAGLSIVVIVNGLPGGWGEVFSHARDAGLLHPINLDPNPSVTYSLWAGVLGGFFLHVAYFGADQSQIQRVLTSKSEHESKRSLMLGGFLLVPQMMLFLFIGIMLHAFYSHTGVPNVDNPNELFPRFVVTELPPGVSGLVVAGVFAAAMSSLDSALNSLSAVSVRDVYQRFVARDRSEAHYLTASRWMTVLWGIFATIFAFFAGNLGPVIEAVNRIGSYFNGVLLGVFWLAILSRRVNGTGAFLGLIVGVLVVWGLTAVIDMSWLYYNLVGVVVVVVTGHVISASTGGRPSHAQLDGLTWARRNAGDATAAPSIRGWIIALVVYFFLWLGLLFWLQSL
ncbi:sodium:solute symporter [Larsenimonas rhizosphaerae]|uniref:sodium:solute symporter n=1 Tax=Larsenimonas rhizosphaerae TaxID=2944682 RepID=UPI0020341CBD|nr:sodium:solute symporter [Larsenimonas rhizosphaerae]MCM2129351.1 sodium:solute symporter [Larsenimonas rhizosphaerae]